jgi:hypothetical protein
MRRHLRSELDPLRRPNLLDSLELAGILSAVISAFLGGELHREALARLHGADSIELRGRRPKPLINERGNESP